MAQSGREGNLIYCWTTTTKNRGRRSCCLYLLLHITNKIWSSCSGQDTMRRMCQHGLENRSKGKQLRVSEMRPKKKKKKSVSKVKYTEKKRPVYKKLWWYLDSLILFISCAAFHLPIKWSQMASRISNVTKESPGSFPMQRMPRAWN